MTGSKEAEIKGVQQETFLEKFSSLNTQAGAKNF